MFVCMWYEESTPGLRAPFLSTLLDVIVNIIVLGEGGRHYKQINMDYQCFHNIIHVHNIVMLGMTIFHKIFFDISRIQSKYGKYLGISCGILSVPHNIVTDLYNVR